MKDRMKDRIIKILQKTTTDNDHEALTAIRLANGILKIKDLHWKEFFSIGISNDSINDNYLITSLKNKIKRLENRMLDYRNKEKKIAQLERSVIELEKQIRHYRNGKNPNSPFIDDIYDPFESLNLKNVSTKEKIEVSLDTLPHNAFLHSLNDWWEAYGYLTPKQESTLNNIYFNIEL